MSNGIRIGLALGGGGARGCAHIGVIKALERAGIPINLIAGTSIGSVVGAVYATNPDAAALQARFEAFLRSEEYRKSGLELFKRKEPAENFFGQVATQIKERVVVNLAQSKMGLVSGHRLRRSMDFLIPDGRIEETRIPFCAIATDIQRAEPVLFTEGEIRPAVTASAAIPGFVPPFEYRGHLLVDGSVACPVPVQPARQQGVDIVIAVDVGQELNTNPDLQNVINVIFQTNHITSRYHTLLALEKADIVVRPKVGRVHWSEFKLLRYMIEEGERVTDEVLPEIQRLIREKGSLWGRLRKAV
jgi:NTE family protein